MLLWGKTPQIFYGQNQWANWAKWAGEVVMGEKGGKKGSLKVSGELFSSNPMIQSHNALFWSKRGLLSQMTQRSCYGRKFSEKVRSCYGKNNHNFLWSKPVGGVGEVGSNGVDSILKNQEGVEMLLWEKKHKNFYDQNPWAKWAEWAGVVVMGKNSAKRQEVVMGKIIIIFCDQNLWANWAEWAGVVVMGRNSAKR